MRPEILAPRRDRARDGEEHCGRLESEIRAQGKHDVDDEAGEQCEDASADPP
jgi:hypothetical protein